MHIKKLEICGFKSFVDKSVIHFDHDIIGIVGPNGCGKSNIVDAIRWCMGEQSAKHLRGRSMEDVIFNGSESRSPHGLAEVTLTFDNSDRTQAETLPETYRDYPEIAVTRRLFRDGTSEYLLNKTQVRLRDITDLFLGTGVGTKAYSIVEQGRIGQIVSSRPQDRRTYIEEAAGITKYRLRRKQAERKMDLTRQNLLRITDIVSEIDRNRGSLKRQAAKAERYVGYRSELEDLFLHDASHRLLEILVTQKVQTQTRDEVAARATAIGEILLEREQGLNSGREEASAIERRFEEATRDRAEADQRLLELTSESERLSDRLMHADDRFRATTEERDQLARKLAELSQEGSALEERIALLSRDKESQDADTAAENEAFARFTQEERDAAKDLDRLRSLLGSAQSSAAGLRSRVEAIEQRSEDAKTSRGKLEEENQSLEVSRERLTAAKDELTATLATLAERKADATENVRVIEQQVQQFQPRLLEHRDAFERVRKTLNLKESRLRALEELHNKLEGVGAGTKALLSTEDPTILGLVADRLEVSEEYTEALAAVMGDRLQCVLVQDPERGLALLDELRTKQRGRAIIAHQTAALEAAAPRSLSEGEELVRCRLVDVVRFADEDEGWVRALLGETLVVNAPSDALTLSQKHPGLVVVSLDGTVVSSDGLVSGGSGDNLAASLVEQKREIRMLREALTELEQNQQESQERCAELEKELHELEQRLEVARAEQRTAELEHLVAEKDQSGLRVELDGVERRRQVVVRELEEFERQATSFAEDAETGRKEIARLMEEERQLEVALSKAEEQASELKLQAAAQAARVTERKVRLAQVGEQLEAAQSSMARVQNATHEATERAERLQEEILDVCRTRGELAARIWLNREAKQHASEVAEECRKDLDDVRELLDQVRNSLSQREGELRELRVELSEAEDNLRDYEMQLQKLALGQEHLLENVSERFRGLDLNRVVGDYHKRPPPDAEHRRRIDELTKLIDRMGPVNLDAKEEYEEAERRFVELNSQREDIEKALSELERAIRHMDRESRRRFKETFDAINGLFKQSFSRLFKGGRAELKLTDPENLLETGVDIVAQPPGKRLGNIELMSGGEKALTATALIFAIFEYRPSPFCVLDEVDAPLDEANVGRYNDAIRSMTDRSQFVVITHIRKTMQSVDVLYGVTMGEPGVSRIVSVKVNNEATQRSSRSTGSVLETQRPARLEEPAQVVA